MERHPKKAIDKMRRIMIPIEIREKMGLSPGDIVTLCKKESTVVLQSGLKKLRAGCINSRIDEQGRMELPIELMEDMRWKIYFIVDIYYEGDKRVVFTARAPARPFRMWV